MRAGGCLTRLPPAALLAALLLAIALADLLAGSMRRAAEADSYTPRASKGSPLDHSICDPWSANGSTRVDNYWVYAGVLGGGCAALPRPHFAGAARRRMAALHAHVFAAQNPATCRAQRFLVMSASAWPYGLGSFLELTCSWLSHALRTNRILVFRNPDGFSYAKETRAGIEALLHPLSNCSFQTVQDCTDCDVEHITDLLGDGFREASARLARFQFLTPVQYRAVLMHYVFQPRASVLAEMRAVWQQAAVAPDEVFAAAVMVRRGDKAYDRPAVAIHPQVNMSFVDQYAFMYPLPLYMAHVARCPGARSNTTERTRIFLMTDSSAVGEEEMRAFPDVQAVELREERRTGDVAGWAPVVVQSPEFNATRHSITAMASMWMVAHRCRSLVLTFTSTIQKASFELYFARGGSPGCVHSLDSSYYIYP